MRAKFWILFLILPLLSFTQTLTGTVVDKATQQPIETVSVYFDNTTIGTTTNEKGEFSITYTDAVQSTLVISYLGYEKVLISDFRSKNDIRVELIEANNELDEVYLEYDDGLTRKQKLKLFREEFLGTSKFAKSCKIQNEDDIILRYDKRNKALYASAKAPIEIINKALQYNVSFDLIDFEVSFRYVNPKSNSFTVNSVSYFGTSFYKNIEDFKENKAEKNREKAYQGSVQHFLRSLYNKSLEENGYWIFHGKFRVNEWEYFKIKTIEETTLKKVSLVDKVSILYDKDIQSEIQIKVDHFVLDRFGNYSPIVGVYFSGALGSQRLGDSLPSDYGIK